jgi:hypothetical protein
MSATLTQQAKLTKYTFDFEIDCVPDRPVPYRKKNSTAMYRVNRAWLQFTQMGDGPVRLSEERIYGHKLKQDGTVGLVSTHETFYSYNDRPHWLTALIEKTKAAL